MGSDPNRAPSGRYAMTHSRRLRLAATALCTLFAAGAATAKTYRVTDLGLPAGSDEDFAVAYAGGINARGDVVANVFRPRPAGGGWQGFLWRDGVARPVGDGAGRTLAIGLNDAGQVVGHTEVEAADGSPRDVPFLFTPDDAAGGTLTRLPTLNPADARNASGIAQGINAAGTIVGAANAEDASGVYAGLVPARFSAAGAVRLPALVEGNGYTPSAGAVAINDAGTIAGFAQAFAQDGLSLAYHAVRIEGDTVQDLGSLDAEGRGYSFAAGINAAGQIAGYAQSFGADGSDTGTRAVIWDGGRILELGTLGRQTAVDPKTFTAFASGYSSAAGLNMSGQAVGKSLAFDADGEPVGEHGFLYEDGKIADLNTLLEPGGDWVVEAASGINDAGQIAATATGPKGTRAVLLTPVLGPQEAALYPRMVAAGRTTRLTLQLGRKAAVARVVSLAASSAVVKVPTRVVVPAGRNSVTIPVTAAPGKRVRPVTLSVTVGPMKMRATLRAMPM